MVIDLGDGVRFVGDPAEGDWIFVSPTDKPYTGHITESQYRRLKAALCEVGTVSVGCYAQPTPTNGKG